MHEHVSARRGPAPGAAHAHPIDHPLRPDGSRHRARAPCVCARAPGRARRADSSILVCRAVRGYLTLFCKGVRRTVQSSPPPRGSRSWTALQRGSGADAPRLHLVADIQPCRSRRPKPARYPLRPLRSSRLSPMAPSSSGTAILRTSRASCTRWANSSGAREGSGMVPMWLSAEVTYSTTNHDPLL